MDRFKVAVDTEGTSKGIQTAIWRGQHQCVSETFAHTTTPPSESRCGEIVVKHQLEGDRGHYSVLNMAFVKLNCTGFPHSVVAQITRHRDSAFLVQSNRYTGDRFVQVAQGEREVEDVFYLRPVGIYRDRDGNKFEYSLDERAQDYQLIKLSCLNYASKIERGCPYEMARSLIPYDFRQDFTIAGTVESLWHWLDQRSKKDSQLEIQVLAQMALDAVDPLMPELTTWYRENRYGRARLAP